METKCRCGRKAQPNKKLCRSCGESILASKKRQNEMLKEQGLCIACRQPSPDSLRCPVCSLKNSLRSSKLNASIDDLFQLLAEQQNRCAYTGLEIQAGVNAAIDHKQPRSKGGSSDLQNLHWVESNINKLKGNMDHSEFLTYLKRLSDSLADTLQGNRPTIQ